MYLLSLRKLIEQSTAIPGVNNASGNIQDVDKIFTADNLALLDENFAGVYAFLIFHPGLDSKILEYINTGALDAQTGNNIMALFCSTAQTNKIETNVNALFNNHIAIKQEEFIVYEIVKSVYPDNAGLFFPGVLIIERFSRLSNAVYVSIPNDTMKEISMLSEYFNKIFRIIDTSRGEDFADKIVIELAKNKFKYIRSAGIKPKELLYKVFNKIVELKGDIISVLGLFF